MQMSGRIHGKSGTDDAADRPSFTTDECYQAWVLGRRVCIRYSVQVQLWLNKKLVFRSEPSTVGFDTALACVEQSLKPGWLPLDIFTASTPAQQVYSILSGFILADAIYGSKCRTKHGNSGVWTSAKLYNGDNRVLYQTSLSCLIETSLLRVPMYFLLFLLSQQVNSSNDTS